MTRKLRSSWRSRAFPTWVGLVLLGGAAPVATGCSLVVDTSKRPSCSTHSECTERYGEPSACVESSCVKLLTDECTQVLPEGILQQDDVILFGLMAALTGEDRSYGLPTKEGAELAFDEVEQQWNGIQGVNDGGQRHLGVLVCDHGSDPKKVARHLVDDVKVPAIIGPSFSGVALNVLDVTVPAKTLLFSATATSPALTQVDHDNLFWRTCPSDKVQAELLKYLVVSVEDGLRTSGSIADDRDAKVALLYKDDAAGGGLESSAKEMLEQAPAAPPVLDPWEDKYPADTTDPSIDWSKYYNELASFGPDIIMALGTTEFVQHVMPGVEQFWNINLPRPWYLLPEGDRAPELTKFANLDMNADLNLAARVVGTAPGARKSPLYTQFAGRFGSAFDHRAPGNLAEFAYDAAYLLFYAIAISGEAYPTGPELADALTKVTCKGDGSTDTTVKVGPTGFGGYFTTAASTQCIDFQGASGELDFDNHTGEATSDIAMWCLRGSPPNLTYDPPLDSYYSASERKVIWKNDTPIDFTNPDWCNEEGKSQ